MEWDDDRGDIAHLTHRNAQRALASPKEARTYPVVVLLVEHASLPQLHVVSMRGRRLGPVRYGVCPSWCLAPQVSLGKDAWNDCKLVRHQMVGHVYLVRSASPVVGVV